MTARRPEIVADCRPGQVGIGAPAGAIGAAPCLRPDGERVLYGLRHKLLEL